MEGFWRRVDKSGDCWVWKGAKTSQGYGVIRAFGEPERAHRVAWVLEHGRIPGNLIVCHHCDNRSCVRPDHLFLGTHQDNSDDKWLKERGWQPAMPGEKNPSAKITALEVAAIRSEYAAGNITQRALGRKYGLSQTQIGGIVRRERWSCIS